MDAFTMVTGGAMKILDTENYRWDMRLTKCLEIETKSQTYLWWQKPSYYALDILVIIIFKLWGDMLLINHLQLDKKSTINYAIQLPKFIHKSLSFDIPKHLCRTTIANKTLLKAPSSDLAITVVQLSNFTTTDKFCQLWCTV